jgi:hypothetical protein
VGKAVDATLGSTHSIVWVMLINLAIDDQLTEEARKIGRHKTKKDAVAAALSEYIARRKRLKILSLFGKIDFDPEYDYKAERVKR